MTERHRRPLQLLLAVLGTILMACSGTDPDVPAERTTITPALEHAKAPAECSGDTPLTPGIPGSPGHLIPSDINPNGMSELAQLMRTMLDDLTAIREDIVSGGQVARIPAAHHRIRCSWPTSPGDRDARFDAMALGYLATVDAFNAADAAGPAEFDAVVKGCLACHAQTCAGPIAAIRPLAIRPLPQDAPTPMFE